MKEQLEKAARAAAQANGRLNAMLVKERVTRRELIEVDDLLDVAVTEVHSLVAGLRS